MSEKDTPPPYSVNSPEAGPSVVDLPPRYTIPEHFTIGSQRTRLLVRPQELKGHLSLLYEFHLLRERVEKGDVPHIPEAVRIMDPERRWAWFVNLAVERWVPVGYCNGREMNYDRRFDRWCTTLERFDHVHRHLPPVDVVWHSYLLNPMYVSVGLPETAALRY